MNSREAIIRKDSTTHDSQPILTVETLDKNNLTDHQGRPYRDFTRKLLPRWPIIWSELLAGHFILILAIMVVILSQRPSSISIITIIASAFVFGYTHAYIQLFFHEAAHRNIAKNHKINDFLANALIGIFIGQDIKKYRPIHFTHHLKLGTLEDTEHTYFTALNLQFILKLLSGITVLEVLASRKNLKPPIKSSFNFQLLLGLLLHSTLLGTAVYYGCWNFAIAWVLGISVFFPFFAAMRQLLEHRDVNASSQVDYTSTDHGAVHRIFGDSLFAKTFGGAGFNRHLLHHFDPSVSYTQLAAIEDFLLNSSAVDLILQRRTTYTKTFFQLMRSS